MTQLTALLANDIIVKADGGGKVPAILKDVVGSNAVSHFLAHDLSSYWQSFSCQPSLINGNAGFIIKNEEEVHAVASFEFSDSNNISEIFIVRNPEKLTHFKSVPIN